MKEVELKVIAELMKHGRKSDREMAKAIGVSQPTVTRTRSRLEKEGIIKEYSMIPDFRKLGFEIMAVTFLRFTKELSDEEFDKVRRYSREVEKKRIEAILMAMNGMGLGYNRVFITFHKSYSSYVKALSDAKTFPYVDPSSVESFIINLIDEPHFQTLTLSAIANYLLKTKEEKP
jgi:DNA-binding Lrp family transcriptional regulator